MLCVQQEILQTVLTGAIAGIEAGKTSPNVSGTTARTTSPFLERSGVEPTNNGIEQKFRPVIIDRKITQGTRGEAGRRWCERIWTALATCVQRGRSAFVVSDSGHRRLPSRPGSGHRSWLCP